MHTPRKIQRAFGVAALLAIFVGCSPKQEGETSALAGTTWQFDHATGLTTVTLNPSVSIQTTTQYLENANQAPFKTEKLLFFDASRFGGIVPVSLAGPVASTGTYTLQGDQVRFVFSHKGYRETPGDVTGLTPDPAHTAAYLRITRQTDDELVLLQDLQSLQEMEAVNQKDPDKQALYVKSTATYYFRRVR